MVYRCELYDSAIRDDLQSEADQKVLLKGQMLDYYDISGCYILRPWSYTVWETIQRELLHHFPWMD